MGRGRKRKKDSSLRRRRDQSARSAGRRTRVREIAGVGCVALTVAAIIALASYSARDPSLNVATGAGTAHNYLGVFGSYLADLLVQLFGFGAWLFPVFAFGAGVLLFAGIAISPLSRLGRLLGLTGFSLALVALAIWRSARPTRSTAGAPRPFPPAGRSAVPACAWPGPGSATPAPRWSTRSC